MRWSSILDYLAANPTARRIRNRLILIIFNSCPNSVSLRSVLGGLALCDADSALHMPASLALSTTENPGIFLIDALMPFSGTAGRLAPTIFFPDASSSLWWIPITPTNEHAMSMALSL